MGVGLLRVAAALIALAASLSYSERADAAPWCGGSPLATDRLPDAVAGPQTHVIYAIAADSPDRFSTYAPIFVDIAGSVSDWWRGSDASRTLRWDLSPPTGCGVPFGDLDISLLRLREPASAYVPFDGRFARLRSAMLAAGFARPSKKYLVYYDGPLDDAPVCGTASGSGPITTFVGVAIVYVSCIDRFTTSFGSVITAHELLHSLGAMPAGAPNTCGSDLGHACDDPRDILRTGSFPSNRIGDFLLDSGRNDYYGHSGSWWDLQDSPFLRQLDLPEHAVALTVVGQGAVSSDLPGIDCSSSCTTAWQQGTATALTAAAAAGFRFGGWSGACSGEATCRLSVAAPLALTAEFLRQVRVRFVVTGGGTISDGAGATCRDVCEQTLDEGRRLELRAEPDEGHVFTGWNGSCAGTGACATSAVDGVLVGAAFALGRYALTVRVQGQGSVTSAPAGISCRTRCGRVFAGLTPGRLTPKPARGWRFVRWAGACSGSRACAVRMVAARRVDAVFARRR